MNLVDRIKGMLVEPRSEWPKVAAEPATVQSLYTGWIMILAAVGPIALLLAMHSIQFAIAQYVLALITTFVLAVIVDALAPTFGGTKDFVAALKLVAYSYTAAWLAGVFLLLGMLGYLLTLIATIYFGWHYISDDIAGAFIAVVSVYLGGLATGQKFDRHGLASHPTTSTADIPVEEASVAR
jgi:hypothetical protein